jgi:peptidoglycan/xylan/chitin deacetylase (PgdA/CDA1 family)
MNLPILMYHSIKPEADPRNDLTVTTSAFRAQLDFLRRRHFQTVTLAHVAQAVRGEARLPQRSVVITFDDAYASLLTHAKPLLEASGFTATVFAVSQALGRHNFWDEGKDLPREDCMRASDLSELQGLGWEIGSHGATHCGLVGLTSDGLRREVADSRRVLEEAIGGPVQVFSYPFGAWDAVAHNAVAESGYVAATAISPGTKSVTADLWALRRVYVKRTDSLSAFSRKISSWYLQYRAWKRR